MKTESKIKLIVYCYIVYGLIVMFGIICNLLLEINGPIWGKFAQGFSFWLIAITIHRKVKGSWWFILISSLYVSAGWLVGFDKVLPESFSASYIFYPTLLLMIVPLILIFTKDVKEKLS